MFLENGHLPEIEDGQIWKRPTGGAITGSSRKKYEQMRKVSSKATATDSSVSQTKERRKDRAGSEGGRKCSEAVENEPSPARLGEKQKRSILPDIASCSNKQKKTAKSVEGMMIATANGSTWRLTDVEWWRRLSCLLSQTMQRC